MGWQDEYQREWKKREAYNPRRDTTPPPDVEPALYEAMRYYLQGRGLCYDSAKRLGGWYPAYYRGPRIIIPCTRSDGGQYWQGRLIETMRMTREEFQFQPQRWDSAHGYRHDAVCYIPAEMERVTIICEGPMDALAAAGLGHPAIAVLGAAPPKIVYDHVALLVGRSYQKNKAVIIPDSDRLGDWVRTQSELGARGVYAMLAPVPYGYKDLAEMPAKERSEFLEAVV